MGAIKATHPDFQYQPIAEPDVSGDAGGSNRYRAVQVRLQLTLELTSSLSGKAA